MKRTTLNKIKVGEFFKIFEHGRVYVRGEYDRSSKTFAYYDFDDVNREHFGKGIKHVIPSIEFEF